MGLPNSGAYIRDLLLQVRTLHTLGYVGKNTVYNAHSMILTTTAR